TSSRDLRAVPGSDFDERAELVLIAIGFDHPEHEGAVAQLGLDLDQRRNVKEPVYGTRIEGVFACGDARTGQSLVVTAIAEGRRCARVVDQYLGGSGEVRRIRAEAMFAYEDGDPHSLRHQAEIARTVTVGDAFWTGPRAERVDARGVRHRRIRLRGRRADRAPPARGLGRPRAGPLGQRRRARARAG